MRRRALFGGRMPIPLTRPVVRAQNRTIPASGRETMTALRPWRQVELQWQSGSFAPAVDRNSKWPRPWPAAAAALSAMRQCHRDSTRPAGRAGGQARFSPGGPARRRPIHGAKRLDSRGFRRRCADCNAAGGGRPSCARQPGRAGSPNAAGRFSRADRQGGERGQCRDFIVADPGQLRRTRRARRLPTAVRPGAARRR